MTWAERSRIRLYAVAHCAVAQQQNTMVSSSSKHGHITEGAANYECRGSGAEESHTAADSTQGQAGRQGVGKAAQARPGEAQRLGFPSRGGIWKEIMLC